MKQFHRLPMARNVVLLVCVYVIVVRCLRSACVESDLEASSETDRAIGRFLTESAFDDPSPRTTEVHGLRAGNRRSGVCNIVYALPWFPFAAATQASTAFLPLTEMVQTDPPDWFRNQCTCSRVPSLLSLTGLFSWAEYKGRGRQRLLINSTTCQHTAGSALALLNLQTPYFKTKLEVLNEALVRNDGTGFPLEATSFTTLDRPEAIAVVFRFIRVYIDRAQSASSRLFSGCRYCIASLEYEVSAWPTGPCSCTADPKLALRSASLIQQLSQMTRDTESDLIQEST